MRFLIDLFVSAIAVMISSYLLGGVTVNNFFGALVVAGVLSLLNTFLRPLLIILTIPITVLTFGLFLLFINALMILLASSIVPGFEVHSFGWALLFGIILSIVMSLLRGILRQYNQPQVRDPYQH